MFSTEAGDTQQAIGTVSRAPSFLISLAIAWARVGQTTEELKRIEQATRHIEARDECNAEATRKFGYEQAIAAWVRPRRRGRRPSSSHLSR
jgi:hypothetical protein